MKKYIYIGVYFLLFSQWLEQMKKNNEKKKEVQKPFYGYCPNYIVREKVYRDLWGLEGGWLKRFCIAMG